MRKLRKISQGRILAFGFSSIILIGAILLMLPISQKEGASVSFTDALFTSTSAVCVTGLITVDPADTFTVFGRTIIAILIQIGGLGVASIGVGIFVLAGKKLGMNERRLVKEQLNLTSYKGVFTILKAMLLITLIIESTGALLSFFVFIKKYPFLDSVGISIFHSISSFNNAGFDILGGFKNLADYKNDILLNLTTAGLVISGGLGFLVILDMYRVHHFRKFSLNTKIVLSTTAILLISGTILFKLSENITWLGAFFNSVSARTAGFSTFPIAKFSNAGLLTLIVLMFIGASPGSTGGGIKTSTFTVLLISLFSTATNRQPNLYKRKIPAEILSKAFVIFLLALTLVLVSTMLVCSFDPEKPFGDVVFEVVSAFGTVGLSRGITPYLTIFSKYVIIFTMFIGRAGPLTVASLWFNKADVCASYSEETVTIG